MATLALAAVASSLTAGLGGLGGALISAVAVASAQYVGGMIDAAIFGGGNSSTQRRSGPRLENLEVMTSAEGDGIPWINGRARVGGTVIWATRIKETVNTDSEEYESGKNSSETVETTNYSYSVSFALAVADTRGSPIRHFGRIWANNRPLDPSTVEVRFYKGTEGQDPDPLIAAVEGEAPAYRGIAYLVFEDLPLADFGNRIPQITVEVFGGSGEVEDLIRGVDLIPGSTEWGYMPEPVKRLSYDSSGEVVAEATENSHRFEGVADWTISLDTLQGSLPNVGTVALVVSWFGDDLRAGQCLIEPRVEIRTKATDPAWTAGGRNRATATLMSQKDGRPVYGSTPADRSVIEAIRDLSGRGLRVVLYPFVMMDIPEGTLPDPSGVRPARRESLARPHSGDRRRGRRRRNRRLPGHGRGLGLRYRRRRSLLLGAGRMALSALHPAPCPFGGGRRRGRRLPDRVRDGRPHAIDRTWLGGLSLC